MKKAVIVYIILNSLLNVSMVFADEQAVADPVSCEDKLDLGSLDPNMPFIKENVSELEHYFTCQAAVKEDVKICNALVDQSPQQENCQKTYNEYYETFGKLFRYGRISDVFLASCFKTFKSRAACDQFGVIMLSGRSQDCAAIEHITPDNLKLCQDMSSSKPFGRKATFMMALRKRDPASCDQLEPSSVAAVCRGLLEEQVDGCQLNAGVSRFKKLYCDQLDIKENIHGTEKEK